MFFEYTAVDGWIDGPSLTHSPSGSRIGSEEYKDGRPHGTSTAYDEDGTVRFTGEYRKGVKHGKHVYYGLNGEKIELYYQDGKVVVED